MSYEMDMSQEKKPNIKRLLPEGRRDFEIVGCEEKTSKSGNIMFVFECKDIETGYIDTWYAVAEQGKRWFLKSILSACGCEAGKDGVYEWDISDVIGKNISGLVIHEDNEYINREGEKVKRKQHKIQDVSDLKITESKPKKEVAWDEDM